MAASFSLRPRSHLHLAANQLAVFNLRIGAPLFAGFLRDWSPLRTGDRGHIVRGSEQSLEESALRRLPGPG